MVGTWAHGDHWPCNFVYSASIWAKSTPNCIYCLQEASSWHWLSCQTHRTRVIWVDTWLLRQFYNSEGVSTAVLQCTVLPTVAAMETVSVNKTSVNIVLCPSWWVCTIVVISKHLSFLDFVCHQRFLIEYGIWKGGSCCWYQRGDQATTTPPLTHTMLLVARLLQEAHSRVRLSHRDTQADSQLGEDTSQTFLQLCDISAPGVTYFYNLTIV